MSDYAIAIPRKKKRRRRKPKGDEWLILVMMLAIIIGIFMLAGCLVFRDIPQHALPTVIVECVGLLEFAFFWYIYWPISKPILYRWIVGEED